jgi:hypothetical protein
MDIKSIDEAQLPVQPFPGNKQSQAVAIAAIVIFRLFKELRQTDQQRMDSSVHEEVVVPSEIDVATLFTIMILFGKYKKAEKSCSEQTRTIEFLNTRIRRVEEKVENLMQENSILSENWATEKREILHNQELLTRHVSSSNELVENLQKRLLDAQSISEQTCKDLKQCQGENAALKKRIAELEGLIKNPQQPKAQQPILPSYQEVLKEIGPTQETILNLELELQKTLREESEYRASCKGERCRFSFNRPSEQESYETDLRAWMVAEKKVAKLKEDLRKARLAAEKK